MKQFIEFKLKPCPTDPTLKKWVVHKRRCWQKRFLFWKYETSTYWDYQATFNSFEEAQKWVDADFEWRRRQDETNNRIAERIKSTEPVIRRYP